MRLIFKWNHIIDLLQNLSLKVRQDQRRLFFKVFRSRNVNGSLSVEVCIIMVKDFFQGINGLRFMFIKSLSKEKNVHMSKVIFIVMNNNTQILNFIWMSFTIIGIQRHFTRLYPKRYFSWLFSGEREKEPNTVLSALPTFSYLVCRCPSPDMSIQRRILSVKSSHCIEEECSGIGRLYYNGHTDSLTIPTHVKQICFQEFPNILKLDIDLLYT